MDAKVTSKLAALELLTMEEIKPQWRKYFDTDPVRFQREYMVRRIAYKIQAKAYGGLPKTITNKLARMAGDVPQITRPQAQVAAGTRLMREYKGKRIYVEVLEEGFAFRGKRYKSLTAIATELMGCRTSGPKFFGLQREADES